ncbi:hypothetical protein RclHR1_02630015 [Rhizophagus clarus]|uniref:D-arabinono-1,4-lactone oxidase n=1 Tax=Rhizophagus clarus TaxID=94130 RepID=A0A2Z6R0W0_9GLOM|nr:hypothetical protein RclHR1_02630015 [Rhizophagus clarus]GES80926.1 FAD-binding protein [Rhizophagus clarus]
MSNSKNPHELFNWINDTIKKLLKTKNDEEKASIVKEIHDELLKLEQVKLPPPSEGRKKDPEAEIHYPETVKEIQDIVKDAYNSGNTIVRVIGSNHSIKDAIWDAPPDKTVKLLSLSKFNGVDINQADQTATVKAGTHLNRDPLDSNSTDENSFNYIIDKAGFALPDLGGIAHQTVGGFLSTGSSGGSLKYSIEDSIVSISLINGKGDIETLKYGEDKFFAAGVSMGLYGIITHVTFKLIPNYYIYGSQVCAIMNSGLNPDYQEGCPIDLLGPGTQTVPSLQKFFAEDDNEYTRLFWWPQDRVNRLTIWKAKRTNVNDLEGYVKPTSPYKEFPEYFGSEIPAQILARIVYVILNLFLSDEEWYKKIAALLLSLFNGIVLQSFQDIWYKGIPMDDQVSDTILPTTFTELWFSIDQTQELMNKLDKVFKRGPSAVGNNATELYTAKESKFWLSPSYGQNVVRIDFLYFEGNLIGTPEEFFSQYWEEFKNDNFRCHWGKYVPKNYGEKVPSLYKKYNDWINIRKEMDPKQIFVTPYWRNILNIEELSK